MSTLPTRFGERFAVDALVGSGGMGTVYRGRDLHTGRHVAIKVLGSSQGPADQERFLQEARLLVELAHPAIVAYVAHGVEDGRVFLAMEWLEGEDLAEHIARRGLTVEETIALARCAASGLAAAHARGIVHRDVKPSNLLLVGGDPARTKVIDFGVARFGDRTAITRSGVVLGTAGYMAPEQARASHDVDARADVFALGCVLFECLTGRPAFTGDHVLAILAKVMLEASPRTRALRPNVPPALDDLIARMLAKDPRERPASAYEVLTALDELGPVIIEPSPRLSMTPRSLTTSEQRFLSLLVVDFDVLSVTTQTLTPEQAARDEGTVRELASRFDAEVTSLGEGTLVLSLPTHGGATAQTARAATAALKVKAAFPEARVALATGRAAAGTGGLPVGPVIDRATALIVTDVANRSHARIDEVTASLLGPHFRMEREGDLFLLLEAATGGDVVRPLLGKPTPCVGREKELALLEATVQESAREPVARCVLVTAPPGVGKSRLRQELLVRARQRGPLTLLSGRADPVGAGSALGLARQLVRHAADLHEGAPVAELRARLRARFATRLEGEALLRVTELLGELVGAPVEEPSPQLRAARNDARILSDRMRRSFIEWLAAECEAGPVVVVLEDLHWGDLPSVSYLTDALRALVDKPLLVLALARPEVHDLFPKLWSAEGLQEIRLGGLTRSASERLARFVLGPDVERDVVTRIVERADGNAFYLEELIRHVAAEGAASLPDSILAMVEARLVALEPEARRVLRAASVFGDQIWERGVVTLLGEEGRAADVAAWLRVLVDRELLVLGRGDKFPSETEYVFRHGLVRDAAYATLTEEDRRAGHGLAASWLEAAGEGDPLILAEHYERGGDTQKAVPWILRAAQAARDGGSIPEALALIRRGVTAAPAGEMLGLLRALEGECFAWSLQWQECVASARQAIELLPRGGLPWLMAVSTAVYASSTIGNLALLQEVVDVEQDFRDALPVSGPFVFSVTVLILGLLQGGHRERALRLLDTVDAAARANPDADPAFLGWCRFARAIPQLYAFDEPGAACFTVFESQRLLEGAGDQVGIATNALFLGQAQVEVGAYDAAIATCLATEELAKKRGLTFVADWAAMYRGRALVRGGRAEEGRALADAAYRAGTDVYRRYLGQTLLAEAALIQGRVDEAATIAREVTAVGTLLPIVVGGVNDILARIALARGAHDEALRLAEEGLTFFARSGLPYVGASLRGSRLAALRALGRTAEAGELERAIRERTERLARATPEAYRAAFLAAEAACANRGG